MKRWVLPDNRRPCLEIHTDDPPAQLPVSPSLQSLSCEWHEQLNGELRSLSWRFPSWLQRASTSSPTGGCLRALQRPRQSRSKHTESAGSTLGNRALNPTQHLAEGGTVVGVGMPTILEQRAHGCRPLPGVGRKQRSGLCRSCGNQLRGWGNQSTINQPIHQWDNASHRW